MTSTFNVGDEVAIYRLGDLHGNPAMAKLDRIDQVTARLYRLRSGRTFSRKTCADGKGFGADRLLPIDDERVKAAFRRQEFVAAVADLVRLAQRLEWSEENEERIAAALVVLRRTGR